MKSVVRTIALLTAIVAALVGCSIPQVPIQQSSSQAQTTQTLQVASTSVVTQQNPLVPTSKPPTATTQTNPTTTQSTITSIGNLQVHFIDVGQGDAILIRTSSGASMLIDGGDTDTGIVQYLKSKGVTRLDMVVATHSHADHIGGLVQVLNAIPVAKVVTNGRPTTTLTYERFLDAIAAAKAQYVEVKHGDTLRLDNIVFTVLNPASISGDDLNNNSLVLRMVYGKVSFLFEGDAEVAAEASMSVSSFSPVSATILKVGHHGSRTSSSPSFLALVKPEVAVYSAGRNNSYGHPHPETLAALAAFGSEVYGTDVNGTVVVTTDGNTYSVIPTTGQARGPPGVPTASIPTTVALVPATTTTPVMGPSSSLTLEIASVTSPVAPGGNATLVAKTSPGTSCAITVYYKSGPSSAAGLIPKTADANGNVSWTWKVGTNTTPGNWRISITAGKDGQSITKETTFTVGP